jgi:hypothetical protein
VRRFVRHVSGMESTRGEPTTSPASATRWPRLHWLARGIEQLVHWLDAAFPIPGTKFRVGLDPIVGLLLPGAGDALGGVVSLSVLFLALQYRLPVWVLARIVYNIGIDAAIGGIPVLGDVFDVVWKSNDKNFALVQAHRMRAHPSRMPLRYWFAVFGLCLLAVACLVAPLVLVVWLFSRWFGH